MSSDSGPVDGEDSPRRRRRRRRRGGRGRRSSASPREASSAPGGETAHDQKTRDQTGGDQKAGKQEHDAEQAGRSRRRRRRGRGGRSDASANPASTTEAAPNSQQSGQQRSGNNKPGNNKPGKGQAGNFSGSRNQRQRRSGQRSRGLRTVQETSAGGLVLDAAQANAALIGRLDRRNRLLWSLPKGHIEAGETAQQAAIREVKEETGIDGEVESELGIIDFWFVAEQRRIHKTVHHFLMHATGGELSDADVEVTEVAWVPLEELDTRLAYADERRLVERARQLLAAADDAGQQCGDGGGGESTTGAERISPRSGTEPA